MINVPKHASFLFSQIHSRKYLMKKTSLVNEINNQLRLIPTQQLLLHDY